MSLILLGVWLASVGSADLGRVSLDRLPRRRELLCLGMGLAVLSTGLLVVDLGWWSRLALIVAGGVLLAGWLLAPTPLRRTACLVIGLLGAVLCAGAVRGERR